MRRDQVLTQCRTDGRVPYEITQKPNSLKGVSSGGGANVAWRLSGSLSEAKVRLLSRRASLNLATTSSSLSRRQPGHISLRLHFPLPSPSDMARQ